MRESSRSLGLRRRHPYRGHLAQLPPHMAARIGSGIRYGESDRGRELANISRRYHRVSWCRRSTSCGAVEAPDFVDFGSAPCSYGRHGTSWRRRRMSPDQTL